MSVKRLIGAARVIAVSDVKTALKTAIEPEIVSLRATYTADQTVRLLQSALRELVAETAATRGDVTLTRALVEAWR
jgi:hypothetical protein